MDSIKALPYLSLGQSLYGMLGKFYKNPMSKLSFSFQSKYLGMAPWECPAFFGLIPYVEHAFGCYHVEGGLSEISQQMSNVFQEYGGQLNLNSPVKQFIMKGKQVKGLLLDNNEEFLCDEVILNADFGHAVTKLIPDAEQLLKKWKPSNLSKKSFSCSTFMVYIALDKIYPNLQHHVISFADDYNSNMTAINSGKGLSDDMSIYVRNASINDPTLSPPGKSGLYVLVPVSNLLKVSTFLWNINKYKDQGERNWRDPVVIEKMKQAVLTHLEKRCGVTDIRNHIEAMEVITPYTWQDERNVYGGATFSLAHGLLQLLMFRPNNKFEELDNLYLAGAGTHPGSGLVCFIFLILLTFV